MAMLPLVGETAKSLLVDTTLLTTREAVPVLRIIRLSFLFCPVNTVPNAMEVRDAENTGASNTSPFTQTVSGFVELLLKNRKIPALAPIVVG